MCVCVCWHSLLLQLADDLCRDRRVEVDGVVSEPLRAFVAFTTPALEGLANADLSAVTILGMVFDTIHILVSLFASRHWTCKGLLVTAIHAHGTENVFGTNGTFGGPRLITVRLFIFSLLLVILAACRGAAPE